jgi:hypothetical protein
VCMSATTRRSSAYRSRSRKFDISYSNGVLTMSKVFASGWLAILTLIVVLTPIRADDADPKKLEAQLEKLLAAYNKDDVKSFFQNWATSVKAITSEMTYDALYKNGAKKSFGDYKAKTVKFRKDGSVLTGDYLVVYFEAEFAKDSAGLIAVNFEKENGEYKFMQVQIQKRK